jgi:hypothetical protein
MHSLVFEFMLFSDIQMECVFITTLYQLGLTSTWLFRRLKAGGGGVNAAIYSAAGPDLECATKKVAQTLSPGTSIVVQLPESSQLYRNEGVTHVIHVLGPNMNPQRPKCLSGDYTEGCRILRSSYASLFQNFSSVVRSTLQLENDDRLDASNTVDGSSREEGGGPGIPDIRSTPKQPSRNAFTVLMQASKRNRELKDANPRGDKVRVTEEVVARAGRGSENTGHPFVSDTSPISGLEKSSLQYEPLSDTGKLSVDGSPRPGGQKEEANTLKIEGLTGSLGSQQGHKNKAKRWDRWALALHEKAMHPEKYTDVLKITDDAVVLHDAYPKVKHFA